MAAQGLPIIKKLKTDFPHKISDHFKHIGLKNNLECLRNNNGMGCSLIIIATVIIVF